MTTNKTNKTTTAQQWLNSRIEEKKLPSGNTAKLQRVDIIDLLAQGAIPDELTGQVEQIINSGKKELNLGLSQFKEFADMLNIVAVCAFVEPKVVAEEEDEDIEENILWANRISATDKIFVFEWANAEANNLKSFRKQQKTTVGRVQPGKGVQPTAVKPVTN